MSEELKKLLDTLTTEQKFEFLFDIIQKYCYLGQGDLIDRLREYLGIEEKDAWLKLQQ